MRAASFALDLDDVGAGLMAKVESIIVAAADAIEGSLDAPKDRDRLVAACEVIVTAQERLKGLRGTRSKARWGIERSRELRASVHRLYERIAGRAKTV
ncbi:MAG: hypothetical protein DMF77_15135 [Acidobacteria bacterium]|nr:MAG: hypothetical protein DMF77_15135 [Acidobacteriota bacterium]